MLSARLDRQATLNYAALESDTVSRSDELQRTVPECSGVRLQVDTPRLLNRRVDGASQAIVRSIRAAIICSPDGVQSLNESPNAAASLDQALLGLVQSNSHASGHTRAKRISGHNCNTPFVQELAREVLR